MYGVAFLQSGLIRNTYFFFLPTQVLLSTQTWVRFSEWLHTWALSRLLICLLVWLPPFVWSSTFLLLWSWASSSFCGFGCIPPSVDSNNFLLLWIRVVSPFCDSSSFLLLWTRATTFWKSEYCNIVGRSGLCEFVCTHVTVGEFAFWNNPTDQIGGRPWKEGGGPFSKLLSSGDTSTNSLSHPILGENSVLHWLLKRQQGRLGT